MSNNGINTTYWGPHAWAFFFSSIAGSYPIKVDRSNKDHMKTVRGYKTMLKSLQFTLPCVFCRHSFSGFLKELPMEEYEHSRKSMMKWLYLVHDRVNKKLMKQERECLEAEKKKLLAKKLTSSQQAIAFKKLKSDILKTKSSPPFERVLAMYEKHRAGCSKKAKKCI